MAKGMQKLILTKKSQNFKSAFSKTVLHIVLNNGLDKFSSIKMQQKSCQLEKQCTLLYNM
jgi:hypothetical protein